MAARCGRRKLAKRAKKGKTDASGVTPASVTHSATVPMNWHIPPHEETSQSFRR